jgi:hypothetical protein
MRENDMMQKQPKRKERLYSCGFHVVFTKRRESQKSGDPPDGMVASNGSKRFLGAR